MTGARLPVNADQPTTVVSCGPPGHPTAVISVFEQAYRVDSTPRCVLKIEDAESGGEANLTVKLLEELVLGLNGVLERMRRKR